MSTLDPAAGGIILDVGALRQMATGSSVYARVALTMALDRGYALVLPTTTLAAARAAAGPSEAAKLHVFAELGTVLPLALGAGDAENVGALLATTPDTDDLPAAHAVLLGLRRHQRILTDRAALLHSIAPDVDVDELP